MEKTELYRKLSALAENLNELLDQMWFTLTPEERKIADEEPDDA